MADTKLIYSHSPASEKRWYERHITVQDGDFGRVIARVYRNPDQDSAIENADLIVDALNLYQRLIYDRRPNKTQPSLCLQGGTVIRLPDERIGTICYNDLDGTGGVWGVQDLSAVKCFDKGWPKPEFMLREKDDEARLREPDQRGNKFSHRSDLECVGAEYELIPRNKDNTYNYDSHPDEP